MVRLNNNTRNNGNNNSNNDNNGGNNSNKNNNDNNGASLNIDNRKYKIIFALLYLALIVAFVWCLFAFLL